MLDVTDLHFPNSLWHVLRVPAGYEWIGEWIHARLTRLVEQSRNQLASDLRMELIAEELGKYSTHYAVCAATDCTSISGIMDDLPSEVIEKYTSLWQVDVFGAFRYLSTYMENNGLKSRARLLLSGEARPQSIVTFQIDGISQQETMVSGVLYDRDNSCGPYLVNWSLDKFEPEEEEGEYLRIVRGIKLLWPGTVEVDQEEGTEGVMPHGNDEALNKGGHGRRHSKEVEARMKDIRKLNAEGRSDGEIASRLGMSRVSIQQRRTEMGLPANFERGGKKRER